MYHFLSGYTAKVAGTEAGVVQADVWLVNTGWTGGPYGTGWRMPISLCVDGEVLRLLKMVRQRRGQRWTEGPGYATAT